MCKEKGDARSIEEKFLSLSGASPYAFHKIKLDNQLFGAPAVIQSRIAFS
jgi:hypothetical protein